MRPLDTLEVETSADPRYAVILMHGLGADANDFVPLIPELHLADAPGVRFVLPNAPEMAVTANNGYVMRAWYDILSFNGGLSREVDEAGIEASRDAIRALIEAQNQRGIPTSRIFLAGFSQGGAMTWTAGLTHPDALAGLIVLSGYLPSPALVARDFQAANRDTPIFAAHGSFDDVLPPRLGEAARDFALDRGCKVDRQVYPMPHSTCLEEVVALRAWLLKRLV
ncbi:alpha/beta hydrolase [Burkholderia glumae]|uniref:alpha/beta hydrolase n=1 Tax=Burkholderia glumae TaxID=337 RepID=UPI003B9D98AE